MAKKEGIFKKIGAGFKARKKRRKEKKITKLGTQYSMTKPAKAKVRKHLNGMVDHILQQ